VVSLLESRVASARAARRRLALHTLNPRFAKTEIEVGSLPPVLVSEVLTSVLIQLRMPRPCVFSRFPPLPLRFRSGGLFAKCAAPCQGKGWEDQGNEQHANLLNTRNSVVYGFTTCFTKADVLAWVLLSPEKAA
jgi:hypothetical protein